MDTLRLLSRSSGLRFSTNGSTSLSLTQPIPSAGADVHHDNQPSRKRKRNESDEDTGTSALTEGEVRQIQKQHKIKITNLCKLHINKHDSRKAQKEASRLFPEPLQTFGQLSHFGTSKVLVGNIAEQAFVEPTEVQLATIPLLLRDGAEEPDLLTVAPTGSGKTLAFLVPLINKVTRAHQKSDSKDRYVTAIVLAPTKELVSQIVNEGRKLSSNTGVRFAEMRKGMRLHDSDDVESSDEGSDDESDVGEPRSTTVVKSDILVSTPLSLVNVLKPKSEHEIKVLPAVSYLILDEADVLLDPLFRDQTLAIWQACNSPTLRVSLWSATIGASIEELAITTIESAYARSGETDRHPLIRTIIGLKDTSLPSISHRLIYASTESGKLMGLRQLLHPARSNSKSTSKFQQSAQTTDQDQPLRPPFLIFTQTINRAQSLYDELQYDIPPSAGGSTRIAVLHSSLTAKQRSDTMVGFRQGKIWILITTDLLSRGIDFRGVNGIVNYDIPTTAASYVHRAGRTGRAGRKGGIAVTFYTRDDIKYLKPIANIISASEKSSNISDPSQSQDQNKNNKITGLPEWLIPALPELTKSSRKDLKARGVTERRAIKTSDDDKQRRRKLQNRIGTQSGYEKKLDDRKRGMIQGSRRRARKGNVARAPRDDNRDVDAFEGFD